MDTEVLENQQKPKLFAMLWSPVIQFERIKQQPRVWIPLLIVTLLYIAASTLTALSMKPEDFMLTGMSGEELEMVMAIGKATAAITGFFIPIFTALISSLIYLIIIKIAKKNTTFKQLFSMNIFIMLIGAIGVLLNSLIALAIGNSAAINSTSLAGVLNSDSPVLATFELFSIWTLVLTAIGLQKVGQLSKTASIIIVIIFFIISLSFAMIGTLISGLAGM